MHAWNGNAASAAAKLPTLPITIVTLGLFLLVVNGLMVALVAHFLRGFHPPGLIGDIEISVVVWLVSWVASWFLGEGRKRAYVKVQDGCILKCTYCIIPHVRPGLSSRSPDASIAWRAGTAMPIDDAGQVV